jgi:RimJ/RimL family protein N-acetyltransferase
MTTIKLIPYDTTKQEEAQEIVDIVLKYYPGTAFPPTLEKMLKTNIKYFRAFVGNDQIGMTGYDLKTPALAETVKTIVFDEFRGKKLGALLSQAIEDECKRVGIKKVMTTIYHYNHAMIAIKLKQGYTIEGYHPDHEAPGFHEYSLGKKLV